MITLKQIASAINEKLKEVLPSIPIQTTDISEGFKRPSLFVDFESITSAAFGARGFERRIQVIIYYFPSDRYKNKIELLDTQEVLENTFTVPFEIQKGFTVYPLELESDKIDGTLQVNFELYYLEINDSEDGDDIGELHLSIEKRD